MRIPSTHTAEAMTPARSPDWRCLSCDAHYHCAVATEAPTHCDRCGGREFGVEGGAVVRHKTRERES